MPDYSYHEFSNSEIAAFEPAMKIGVLATISDDGLPHLTMISTLKASAEKTLAWGQFMEGRSKNYIQKRPEAGWLIMTLDRNVWRGRARFTHTETSGADFDFFNNQPLFRYNSYFGVHRVYYMDLVSHSGKQPLPMNRIVIAAIKTLLARSLSRSRAKAQVMNRWTQRFLNKLDNLKFLGYIDINGYPVIVPAIQAQVGDPEHVLFSTSVFQGDLEEIPQGTPMAVFGLALTMEDVLLRGEYEGARRYCGFRCGSVKIDWVYNPMPPVPGQVYPPVSIPEVREF